MEPLVTEGFENIADFARKLKKHKIIVVKKKWIRDYFGFKKDIKPTSYNRLIPELKPFVEIERIVYIPTRDSVVFIYGTKIRRYGEQKIRVSEYLRTLGCDTY